MCKFTFSIDSSKKFLSLTLVLCFVCSCAEEKMGNTALSISDNNLSLELISQETDIMTPIGMVIDNEDAIYILESHTHTAKKGYSGPKYDRIKKSVDTDNDGIPEEWLIYADSIEDGMNLTWSSGQGLFLTTKNEVYRFFDKNGDGINDGKERLLEMVLPENVYDHAGILGIATGPENWLYVSRGNTGGSYWKIVGSDGSAIDGYGDGGSILRCKVDGSRVEQIATGFWNPFDLKFDNEGRLFATDNDPDSRGPNRLVEIVPGGDYGYKSLYGGSGIHPYLSWNGELPGTLPYAAPLGEAPCALIDATHTNFGKDYETNILVNIWEENNIVRIPLRSKGSTVQGEPEILVQGDSLFHPVAFATNNKGDLYITDWVLRQYPNHGRGRIWRMRAKDGGLKPNPTKPKVNRFSADDRNTGQLISALTDGDAFEQAIARYYMAKKTTPDDLTKFLKSDNEELRLQILLTFFDLEEALPKTEIISLLNAKNLDNRKMALIYIGRKGLINMLSTLKTMLLESKIEPELFEVYLATVRHLQPQFIAGMNTKVGKSSNIPRKLPVGFIESILRDKKISETVKAVSLIYLPDFESKSELLTQLLHDAKEEVFQKALIRGIRYARNSEPSEVLKKICLNGNLNEEVRAMALMELSTFPTKYFIELLPLLHAKSDVLQYAAVKYVCLSKSEGQILQKAQELIEDNIENLSTTSLSVWNECNGNIQRPSSLEGWYGNVNLKGNAQIGQLVYENRGSLCTTCHKVKGWGGTFGPELSKIASSKSQSQLINSVLRPSLEISPEWQGWFLIDKQGTRHTGRQIDVHEGFAELMNINGNYDKFSNPKSYGVMKSSIMPEGLHNSMTTLEFNDLVAYLSTLK